ncbi:MAG TPA: alpha/beta fold hydrolase [Candidatus Didemnitutus sp.]|nr:alpha/beta fold hydrolase [Candidatus Didemnitutus sp.]
MIFALLCAFLRQYFGICVVAVLVLGALPALRASEAPVGGDLPAAYRPLHKIRLPGVEEDFWGGTLRVFENRQTRVGRTIDLNVIVIPALEQADKREPFFWLDGGPGVAATQTAALYATDLREYRRHRDVVLVDQRGTGKSNPLGAAPDPHPQRFVGEMYPVDYVRNLRRTLEQRADLTQYTTPIAMDDLDDVRAWLGYDQIDLCGLSYGTRAAMVYLGRHPQHVHCLVLMGVAPTFMKIPLYFSRDANRAMNLLLDECEGDPTAAKAFPVIRREWSDLLARLGHRAARVRYRSRDGSVDEMVSISRDVFAENIRFLLYDPAAARRIPLIIHEAARGNFDPFLAAAIPADRNAPDVVADGLYLSITASEDTSRIDPAEARRAAEGSPFGTYRVDQQMRAASLWPHATLPPGYDQPVESNVPVLILTGFMDPVTPPSWGDEVARHFSRCRHVIIPHSGHIPFSLSHPEILDRLILDFLDSADPAKVDPSGLARMLPPPFATAVAN